jgi:hypothetical protein
MAPSRAVAYEAWAQPVGRDGNKLSVGDESAISAPKARSRCRDAVYPSPLHPSKADIPNPTLCESAPSPSEGFAIEADIADFEISWPIGTFAVYDPMRRIG